jgi:hypothetical protein
MRNSEGILKDTRSTFKPATMRLLRLLLFVAFIFPSLDSQAQTSPDSTTGAGSKPFKTGSSRNFWMGSNYRKEWNTVVKAPTLNLATEKGGLTPVKRGGGKQTRSLRLEDKNGRQYSLRSIQKFITSKTLPGDLQSEAAADLVADGVSASYPYSVLSVAPLADAAGIAHLETRLVYIGDDPKLDSFRKDFGNMLALFEKRIPDSVQKSFDTDEVADKLKDDNDNAVNQHQLLKVRILDMFVMDLDRHEDQWEWGAYDNGKGKTYYPIAKDRDQAFYTNQGLLPGIVKWPWLVPQLQGFRAKSKNIRRFNFAARNLDRFFLNQLTEAEWRSAAETFVSQMTDAVIDKAIDQQPVEIRSISGEKIKQTLKDRRQNLVAEVMDYYRFISTIVDVTASDKKELFEITRNDDGSMLVQIYKITKEGEQSTKMYERLFDGQTTEEVRLYGFAGEDKFVIKGNNDKIKLRMIGGDGEDTFESNVTSGKGGIVYDTKSDKNTLTGALKDKRSNDTIVNQYQRIYYKYNQNIPFLAVGFNQDDGLSLGFSFKIIHHGFRKDPYKNLNEFVITHALATKAFRFGWNSEYIGTFGRTGDLLTQVDIKAPNNTTNFFGYGNTDVEYDKNQPGSFRYYRARYNLGDISILYRKRFSPKVWMTLGPTYQFFSLDENDKDNASRFITDIGANGLDPATLYEKQSYFGGKFSFDVDSRDNKVMPRKGVNWSTNVRYLSGNTDASYKSVTQVNSEFTFYLNLVPKRLQIANRFGGGHNFGDGYEFYQAQYLGSDDHLRGFRKYRFAGDSKIFNNVELRWAAAKFRTYLFPGSLGFLFFYDTGRVFTDGFDTENKWKSGYGGGFWIAPLNRLLLNFTYATSKEDKLFLFSLGWKF